LHFVLRCREKEIRLGLAIGNAEQEADLGCEKPGSVGALAMGKFPGPPALAVFFLGSQVDKTAAQAVESLRRFAY